MIFISYSWRNFAAAVQLEEMLLEAGLEYWLDRNNLDLGHCIKSQINNALRRSHRLLHLSSEASRASPWVRFELNTARKLRIEILEVTVHDERKNGQEIAQATFPPELLERRQRQPPA